MSPYDLLLTVTLLCPCFCHVYSNIDQLRKLLPLLNSTRTFDLWHPIDGFVLIKELHQLQLVADLDLLGAGAALTTITEVYNVSLENVEHGVAKLGIPPSIYRLLESDKRFIDDVKNVLNTMSTYESTEWYSFCRQRYDNSVHKCLVDAWDGMFYKKEMLTSDMYIIHDLFSSRELKDLNDKIQKDKQQHMYQIYQERVDLDEVHSDTNIHPILFNGYTIPREEIRKLLVTREFGREGQLYHPFPHDEEQKLIEAKLRVVSSESSQSTLQISTYGIGGHMSPHYDTYRQPGEPQEDRDGEEWSTSAIGYLSSVLAGGRTVFPRLGVAVAPEAGAVLVWRNIGEQGDVLVDTLHAACPVLYGEKWIFNKSWRKVVI